MPEQVKRRALTRPQEAVLIALFKAPNPMRIGLVRHTVTAVALLRKGYIRHVYTHRESGHPLYGLTQAGIRYNQTGKEIGE